MQEQSENLSGGNKFGIMERAFEFRKARKLKKIQIISSSFERIPKNTLSISSDNINGVLKLIEIIKAHY